MSEVLYARYSATVNEIGTVGIIVHDIAYTTKKM